MFLGSLLSTLAGPLMKEAVPFGKSILAHNSSCFSSWCWNSKIRGSGTTTLRVSNKEMNDIMKIVQAL